jgi:hypothetical protein
MRLRPFLMWCSRLFIAVIVAISPGDARGQQPRRSGTEPRRFGRITVQRPLFPTFATRIEDCAAYQNEWHQILERIRAESAACSGANAMADHATPIPSCVAYFPAVLNVGGCYTYSACREIADQFWSTLHTMEEEAKECTDHVARNRMFEKRPITDPEQKMIDDLLRRARDQVPGLKAPAKKSLDGSQTVMQNALTDYLDAMKKAAEGKAPPAPPKSDPSSKPSVARLGEPPPPPAVVNYSGTTWVCSDEYGPATAPVFLPSGGMDYTQATAGRNPRAGRFCDRTDMSPDNINKWQQKAGRVRWTCYGLGVYEGTAIGDQMTVVGASQPDDWSRRYGPAGLDLFSLPLQFVPMSYSCARAR